MSPLFATWSEGCDRECARRVERVRGFGAAAMRLGMMQRVVHDAWLGKRAVVAGEECAVGPATGCV